MLSLRQPISNRNPLSLDSHYSRKPRSNCSASQQRAQETVQNETKELGLFGFLSLGHKKQEIVRIVCLLLKSLIKNNSAAPSTDSIFDLNGKVSIQIEPFVERIVQYMKCSQSCYIVALILLDRLQTMNSTFALSSSNIHKLLITSMLIAVKYTEDDIYKNTYYAKIGGITLKQLNILEIQFLNMIEYNVYVSEELLNEYSSKLENYLLKKSSKKI